jgi:hypothetical protein
MKESHDFVLITTLERCKQNFHDFIWLTHDNRTVDVLIRLHREAYLRSVFFERIAPSDYDPRLRLADELKKYGGILFPGEELLPHYFMGMNLEEVIKSFLTHLEELRREWRY